MPLKKSVVILVSQIRAARALLDWTQPDLATAAGLALATVKRFEKGTTRRVSEDAIAKMRVALEAAGAEFFDEDFAGGAGVRFSLHHAEMAKAAAKHGLSHPHIAGSSDSLVRLVCTDGESQINVDIGAADFDAYFGRQFDPAERREIVANSLEQITEHVVSRYAKGAYRVTPGKGVRQIGIEIGADDLEKIEPQIPWTKHFFPDDFPPSD